MTAQEAIEILKIERSHMIPTLFPERIEAMNMAIKAIAKQIPKKLIAEGDGYADGEMVYDSFYCPSCDHHMEDYEVEDYCPNCGQKICWEDE